MLTIAERIRDDGTRERVTLDARGGDLFVTVGDGTPARLPAGALERVMARYGKPLASEIALDPRSSARPPENERQLELGEGRTLLLLRHLARYDVIARDFLVWIVPGEEPLAELAVAVSAALVHLARVAPPESGGLSVGSSDDADG